MLTIEPWMANWVILPTVIFLARILDVSIGTLRIMFVAKGMKYAAPILGFIESLAWLLAITQIIQNLTNWAAYVAFAGGFAAGNYVGIWLEEQLAVGLQVVQVITKKEGDRMMGRLKDAGYGLTSVTAEGNEGVMRVIYTVVKRVNVEDVVTIVKAIDPNAFITIEDVRAAEAAQIPYRPPRYKMTLEKPVGRIRRWK